MRFPRWLRRSIGLTQAVFVLLASLAISLTLSTLQLSYTFLNQHQAAISLSEEILTLAEGGATTASWTLDERLAIELIQSVIALKDVQSATLLDERGVALARAERQESDYSALTTWFARKFIGDSVRGQRSLSVEAGGGRQNVGAFLIVLAPEQLAVRFLGVAKPVLLAGLIQALAIALMLLWLSSRLLTSPLQRAALAIAEIDPENPDATHLIIPPPHEEDELGHLLAHTNKMIVRLSSVQAQLRTLATHDPLTKLPNRSFVVTKLESAVARAKRNQTRVAVLFLDLDNFKTINDTHGHSHGDELLVQVAKRLGGVLRSNDTAGRLGGDEFLLIIEDIANAEDVMPTVKRIKAALSTPISLDTLEVWMKFSMGIAVFPDDGQDAVDLMRHSDMAMYQAKEEPGSRFNFFAQEMSERMQARLSLETELHQALELKQFELAYQPKIAAQSGQLAGCEVLLRWRRDGRLAAAGEFIDAAEQLGIMVDIGNHVLEQACKQARDWATRLESIPIAINVSARQLRDSGFTEQVLATVRRFDIEPRMLELEITETVLIEELNHAFDKLDELRHAGFQISIDDFGTGYSSLSYLTHLPANSLKIDRSFVSGPQSSDIVLNMVIAMAQELKLTTIAEGVETEEQRDKLIAKGCDVLQGYLLGRPMSAREFEEKFLTPRS